MLERRSLLDRKCKPCDGGTPTLAPDAVDALLSELDGWSNRAGAITKTFRFPDYWQTMAFVNALAWISHREDHHPDLLVGYGSVRVDYSTHAIGGLSENDFICAAKVDALYQL